MTTNSNEGTRRRALGKGLDSLLPRIREAEVAPAAKKAAEPAVEPKPAAQPSLLPTEVAVDRIDRSPYQTRTHFNEERLEDLARSVRVLGVVQPVVVRPLANGRFQLIAGERRWRAAQMAGLEMIPVVVRQVPDSTAMEMTIVENLQRADLNPMEQARAYEWLSREFKLSQEKMAERTGMDRTSVANFMRLLRLPEGVQRSIEAGDLSFGHGRALLALEAPKAMELAALYVLEKNLSVRQTEKYVQGLLEESTREPKPEPKPERVDPNVREAQEQLQRALGLKVHIEDKNGRGRVIIEYARLEDFDALLDAIIGEQ